MPNLFGVRLFREPDAGNPPVRFDEREEETELSQTGLRRRGESLANRHRKATVTAPLLDSTQNLPFGSGPRSSVDSRISACPKMCEKLSVQGEI